MLRSPWTLECPRTGHNPAPGLPMLPWRRARLAISLIVATALRCWVIPMAQQMMVREEETNRSARRSICARVTPVASYTADQSSSRRCAAYACLLYTSDAADDLL